MQPVDVAYVLKSPVTEQEALACLDNVHPSWFVTFFNRCAGSEIDAFLSALLPSQAGELATLLHVQPQTVELKPSGTVFLRQVLLEEIVEGKTIFPRQYLGKNPLDPLLHLPYEMLLEVVDKLGLRDRAAEMRKIIETTRINKIYSVMTASEKAWVHELMRHQEPVVFKGMGVNQGEWDATGLRALIRQRGINRLAKAVYGQESSWIWYLEHRLDKELAIIMRKLCVPTVPYNASQVLQEQVLEAISYVQKEKT